MNKEKLCPRCKNIKSFSEFPVNNSKKDGLGSHCSECKKNIQKQWYLSHRKEQFIRCKKYRKTLRDRFLSLITGRKCVDCGNDNPIVLDFDHVRGKKVNNVSRMVAKCLSWQSILDEIDKCEVRCANCHRIVTHNRRISNTQAKPQ